MSFNTQYVTDGFLDRVTSVGHIDSGRFDDTPTLPHPFACGSFADVPRAVGTLTQTIAFSADTELSAIGFEAKTYNTIDRFQLVVGDQPILNKASYQPTPEGIYLLTPFLIPKGEKITLIYLNESGEKNELWYYFNMQTSDTAASIAFEHTEFELGIHPFPA